MASVGGDNMPGIATYKEEAIFWVISLKTIFYTVKGKDGILLCEERLVTSRISGLGYKNGAICVSICLSVS